MSKEETNLDSVYKTLAIAMSILFVITLIYAAYSTIQKTTLEQNLTIINSKYSAVLSNLTSTKNSYNSLSSKYNNLDYNLTHTYNKTIFNQKTINLPRYNSTYTVNATLSGFTYIYDITEGALNYSFYVPYPGYLIFNATSTLSDSSSCNWDVYFTLEKPYYVNQTQSSTGSAIDYNLTTYIYNYFDGARMSLNSTRYVWSYVCPDQNKNYVVPVSTGTNYILFYNNNSTNPVTITFNAKYVGYHTN